jgi:uncharacterized protein (TIGR00296 family)
LRSALRDRRFEPIAHAELASLHCSVSLLTTFEPAKDHLDWEVGTHGLIIYFQEQRAKRSATYLPEVAAREGWSKEATIESLIRKAGFRGEVTSKLKRSLEVTRYQSTKSALSYSNYLLMPR